jgi:hypothetical protein
MVAERHLRLLDFFLDHKIFFDGQKESFKQYQDKRGNVTHEIHFESDSYETFRKRMIAKTYQESGKPDDWISSRKMYSLVGIINLILSQMDYDDGIAEYEFEDKWNHFLDILEEETYYP